MKVCTVFKLRKFCRTTPMKTCYRLSVNGRRTLLFISNITFVLWLQQPQTNSTRITNRIATANPNFQSWCQLCTNSHHRHQEHASGWCRMVHSTASQSPPQCTVSNKLWNIVQFDAKVPHFTKHSCQPGLSGSARSSSPIRRQMLIDGSVCIHWSWHSGYMAEDCQSPLTLPTVVQIINFSNCQIGFCFLIHKCSSAEQQFFSFQLFK